MTNHETETVGPQDDDRLNTIADAIREQFGDDAMTVARIQMEAADHDSRPLWETILARLSDR